MNTHASAVLRITLEDGHPEDIAVGRVAVVQTMHGRTFVDCGLVAYACRESVLQVKLALDSLRARAT